MPFLPLLLPGKNQESFFAVRRPRATGSVIGTLMYSSIRRCSFRRLLSKNPAPLSLSPPATIVVCIMPCSVHACTRVCAEGNTLVAVFFSAIFAKHGFWGPLRSPSKNVQSRCCPKTNTDSALATAKLNTGRGDTKTSAVLFSRERIIRL